MLKGDQVLAQPDHVARAAYEARMEQTVALADEPSSRRGRRSAAQEPARAEAPAARRQAPGRRRRRPGEQPRQREKEAV